MGSSRFTLNHAFLIILSISLAGCDGLTGNEPKIGTDEAKIEVAATPIAGQPTPASPVIPTETPQGSGWGQMADNAFPTTVPATISTLAAAAGTSEPAPSQASAPIGGPPALTAPDPALADSSSLYLRQAQKSAVYWRMWTPEAFNEAATRGVPVVIVVGAAWSHDALAMDEVFNSPEISNELNNNYVPIRVDADERPDIWGRYSLAFEVINKERAKPSLTAFALPDGRPFDVIGRVPAAGDGTVSGMKELLAQAGTLMKNQQAQVTEQAASIEGVLAKLLTEPRAENAELSSETIDAMARELAAASKGEGSDALRAGRVADFLLYHFGGASAAASRDAGSELLLSRFRSGQRDHVLGGYFFRRPGNGEIQFGKVLPVQAEMISANAHAYAATGKALHKEGVTEVLRFCRDSLEASEGGFYSGQSPDTGAGDSGGYFTYSREEIREIVGDDTVATVFSEYLNAKEGEKTNLHVTGRLQQAADAAGVSYAQANESLNSARMKLHAARMEAEQVPPVDKAILAGWNGDMICAYLEAADYIGDTKARDFALKTADRLIETMVSEQEGVARVMYKDRASGFGFLEDNVKVAAALIRCYQATNQSEYLESAKSLMEYVEARFLDKDSGLYQDVASNATAEANGLLKLKRLSLEDDISRSPNAVAAMVWYQLADAAKEDSYKERAARMVKAALERRQFNTEAVTTWGQAAVLVQHGSPVFKK